MDVSQEKKRRNLKTELTKLVCENLPFGMMAPKLPSESNEDPTSHRGDIYGAFVE